MSSAPPRRDPAGVWAALKALGYDPDADAVRGTGCFSYKEDRGACAVAALELGVLRMPADAAALDAPALLASGKPLAVWSAAEDDQDEAGKDVTCRHAIRPTLRQLLRQPDASGTD